MADSIAVLIGALGGEGGGVLTDWIVEAARLSDYPVQSTSIPGVAQRTGATTYYVEIYPETRTQLGGKAPVLALYPAPGRCDLVIASEIVEAGRALELGFVTPERTTLIASTHRIYSILEKSAMGDGIIDHTTIERAAQKIAQRAILFDMARLAESKGAVLNAVALGVIAASGRLPIPEVAFENAIKEGGVAVESNLRGFRAGIAYMKGEITLPDASPIKKRKPYEGNTDDVLAEARRSFPGEALTIVEEGVRRLVDYQNPGYAKLYLDRLKPILAADTAAGGAARSYKLTAETGRYLALWMSYEDVIRVADIKSRASRMMRVRNEVAAKATEPVRVTEFLKPGFEEIASVLPPALGRGLMGWAQKSKRRMGFNFAMRVRTDTVFGFVRLWGLAKMKPLRPRTYRYAEENREIGTWLEALRAAASRGYGLALEITELPNLRKGYSDTHRRGSANYRQVFEQIVLPAARGTVDALWAEQAVKRARQAALTDPDGDTLANALAALSTERTAPPVRAAAE